MKRYLNIYIEFEKKNIFHTIHESIINNTKGYICTINANLIVNAKRNKEYAKILDNSFLNICDGSVIASAINWVYKLSVSAFPGPDLFIEMLNNSDIQCKHYFLGSTEDVLLGLKENLIKLRPEICNSIFESLPFSDVDGFNYQGIAEKINKNKPDIIWLSLGAPKQEQFASMLLPYLNKGIIICVGAAFDFYGSSKGRAPLIIRKLKLEWFWRLIITPSKTYKRLKHEVLILPGIILKEKILQSKNHSK